MPSRFLKTLGRLAAIPGLILIATIHVYQRFLSPLLGPRCRFHPSCSNYMIGAVQKHGLFVGVLKGLWRVIRCNPWNPGGFDPP